MSQVEAPGQPEILDRDDGLVVVSKPSGYAIHPTGTPGDYDIVTWFAEAYPNEPDAAPAHRLDRATSGLVLLSTDRELLGELGGWFGEGLIKKEYRALVIGHPRTRGIIRRDLKDKRRGKNMPAVTRYKKLEDLPGCALLSVTPETGRRHQIRRHLQGLGHAIVGDERYRPRKFRPIAGFPGRLWLHAYRLELPDGRSFVAPLPPELKKHLALLRSINAKNREKNASS